MAIDPRHKYFKEPERASYDIYNDWLIMTVQGSTLVVGIWVSNIFIGFRHITKVFKWIRKS